MSLHQFPLGSNVANGLHDGNATLSRADEIYVESYQKGGGNVKDIFVVLAVTAVCIASASIVSMNIALVKIYYVLERCNP